MEKIGIIHLYTLGYRDEDLVSFTCSLNNPSKIAEMQELEQPVSPRTGRRWRVTKMKNIERHLGVGLGAAGRCESSEVGGKGGVGL